MKTKHLITLLWAITLSLSLIAQTQTIHIANPKTWSTTNLSLYVGKTVVFDRALHIDRASGSSYSVAPRRTFNDESQLGLMSLSGAPSGHRTGEMISNLTVVVKSTTSLTWKSGTFVGNSYEDLEAGPPSVDMHGTHRILVCAANLEYYLAAGLGSSGMGPSTAEQHQRQRTKTSKAMAAINADIYGFAEIESGDVALQEIADDLHTNTGRNFAIVSDNSAPQGTYTKVGYVYCPDIVKPVYQLFEIDNPTPLNRKKIQGFEEISTGEVFYFSMNHFKAKSGASADQYNADRVKEANAVYNTYSSKIANGEDPDILVMGDLNSYAGEDPINVFISAGFTDLHKAFHADTSYSYKFSNTLGYLDHALCNSTLLPQITGMQAYHINSDEDDCHTYNGSCSDLTMFRASDHDPVLVGLALKTYGVPDINCQNKDLVISNADKFDGKCYYAIYTIQGTMLVQKQITGTTYDDDNHDFVVKDAFDNLASGIYIVYVYENEGVIKKKIAIP